MVVKDFEKCSISRQTLLMLLMQTLQVNELLPSNGVPFRPGPAVSLRTVWQFSCAVWSCCQLDGPDTCSQPTDRHSSSAVAGFRHQCRGVTEARCLGFIIRQIRSHRLFFFFLKDIIEFSATKGSVCLEKFGLIISIQSLSDVDSCRDTSCGFS